MHFCKVYNYILHLQINSINKVESIYRSEKFYTICYEKEKIFLFNIIAVFNMKKSLY